MEFELFADENQEEIERLVTNIVNAMAKANYVVDWSKVDLGQFNPEFRRRWISEASNVSDETLQDLWARLLAGELESPGSVSNDTMSIARDLTKERAGEFQTLCSAALCKLDGTPVSRAAAKHTTVVVVTRLETLTDRAFLRRFISPPAGETTTDTRHLPSPAKWLIIAHIRHLWVYVEVPGSAGTLGCFRYEWGGGDGPASSGVKGGGKLGHRGVAVQDKCPAKCSA